MLQYWNGIIHGFEIKWKTNVHGLIRLFTCFFPDQVPEDAFRRLQSKVTKNRNINRLECDDLTSKLKLKKTERQTIGK